KFDGFVDTAPWHDLIHREIQAANLRRARVRLQVGAVNMESGAIVYADAADPDIVDRIYASAAVPIVMPLVRVAGADYYDGGVRDVVPVGKAINQGAREMVVIVCQARELQPESFPRGHPLAMASRLMDIVTDEI